MATWSSPMSFISFLLPPKGEVRFLYAFCIPLSCTMLRSVYCCCSAFRKVFMGQGRMKRYSTSAMYSRAMSVSVVCVFSLVPILSRMTSLFYISCSGRVRVSAFRPALLGCPCCRLYVSYVSVSSMSSSSSIDHSTRLFSSMAFCCFLKATQSSLVLMPLLMLFLMMNLTM